VRGVGEFGFSKEKQCGGGGMVFSHMFPFSISEWVPYVKKRALQKPKII